jgi:hypothetical protein
VNAFDRCGDDGLCVTVVAYPGNPPPPAPPLDDAAAQVTAAFSSTSSAVNHWSALAADGKLIVAEVGAKRIIQIDPANGTITEIAANLPIGLPAAPGGCRATCRRASGSGLRG